MIGAPKGGNEDVISADMIVEGEPAEGATEGVAAAEADGLMAPLPEEPVDEVEEEAQAAEELAAIQEAVKPTGAAPTDYAMAIENAITHFRSNPALFSKENLPKLSPKFQRIIDNIGKGNGSKGPVLVYSNFKTLEGTGLFGVALENQLGYVKLELVRDKATKTWSIAPQTMAKGKGVGKLRYIAYTGDEWREARRVLLDIFNAKWSKLPPALKAQVDELTGGAEHNRDGGIVKVFMITQSGAEGISLSNVRQVHLMEPYWNYVRLEQVKGRAIRICSHMDLPPEERNVEVFTYLATVGDAKVAETIKNHDESMTSDQIIFRLMNTKKKLADELLEVMQKSAVDCKLNHLEHGVAAEYCFSTPFDTKSAMNMNFHPRIKEDFIGAL
jgi:hypothetical protein